ncbi:hypothetical protein JCM5350_000732 [Sporobolomyces pararoseus]
MVTTRGTSKAGHSRAGASSNDASWVEKPSKVNKRGSSGSKQRIEELEEEEEVCSFFTPVDLLHLSQTSKAFFTLVDGVDFNPVWIAARKLVNLPELSAKDLSNLKYAALVYGDHCQVCGKKGRTSEDFFVRKRYCWPCRKAKYVSYTQDQFQTEHSSLLSNLTRLVFFFLLSLNSLIPVHKHVRKIKAHNFLYECALSTLHGGGGANLSKTVYYDFPSLIPLNKELHEISSRINALRPDDYRSNHSTNHMAVARRYKALLDKGEEDDEFEEDERELREFVTDKRELKECVQRDAEKLENRERSRPAGGW